MIFIRAKKTILSLFDASGTWSKPYREAGFNVIQIDLKLGKCIFAFDPGSLPRSSVFGVLAAPPCTDFTRAGSNLWKAKDISGQTAKSILLIKRTFFIIGYYNPSFWCLENPPGRLETLFPDLTRLRLLSFEPYHYGDPYKKYTNLYGRFNPFLVTRYVKPLIKSAPGQMSVDHYYIHFLKQPVPRNQRAEFRSITPPGFAQAFFDANH